MKSKSRVKVAEEETMYTSVDLKRLNLIQDIKKITNLLHSILEKQKELDKDRIRYSRAEIIFSTFADS